MPERFEPWRVRDLLLICGALLLVVASGIGLRDPWPADEPRFAALARDMWHSREWLFPRVGGDLYQDKPPLYFWLLSLAYGLTGSVRASFLLPSLLAAGGVLGLVYDMGRRLAGARAGLCAALTLLATIQFITTMRSAQIDATLCLLMSFSLYALMRHLFWGPAWGWYFIGGLFAGLGVFTKGVGFLPILVLLQFAWMRRRGWNGFAAMHGGWRWWIAPLAMFAGICLWFIPMLLAVHAHNDPEYTAYRNEILFGQTVTRYASAWHHHQPWHYFLVQVIPLLWLPFSLLLFWLVPRWRGAWRARDARVWLPLGWVLIVLLFFSASPGKRSIYLNPALPALALAAAPFLPTLFERRGIRRAGGILAAIPVLAALVLGIGHLVGARFAVQAIDRANLSGAWPLWLFLALAVTGIAACLRRAPMGVWLAVLAALALTWGYAIAPAMNAERSGGGFMRGVVSNVGPAETLGLVAYKEQFLLYLSAPTVNFGHRRWREGDHEVHDAAAWLAGAPGRVLLVPRDSIAPCFAGTQRLPMGRSSQDEWDLVRGAPDPACIAQGDAGRAILYRPPP